MLRFGQAARLLWLKAGWLKNQGKPFSKQAAMSKLYCSEVMGRVVDNAVQVFGGYGFMKDYPIEKFMRDAKITQIYEGTSEIQLIVISNHVLKDRRKP